MSETTNGQGAPKGPVRGRGLAAPQLARVPALRLEPPPQAFARLLP